MEKMKTIHPLQIQQMFAASHASLVVGVLLAAILAYMQREVIPVTVVETWFALIVLIALVRAVLIHASNRSPANDLATTHTRLVRFRIGVLASGAVWGAASFLMFPAHDPQHQMFLIFMLAGLTSGGVVSFSADLFSAIGYALTVLLPLIFRLLMLADGISVAMLVSVLLYLGFMVITSRYIHRSISENLSLRFDAIAREEVLRQRTSELELHNRTLSRINQHTSLSVLLDDLVNQIEAQHPDMICSILLLDADGKTLRHGAAPRLPDFYNRAIDGLAIGDGLGSCGTAAYRGERVIVEDVQQHPYWTPYRTLAHQADVRSCWSQPFKRKDGTVLGTFAIYHRQPTMPSESELQLIERYANLAQAVIESYRAQNELSIAATAFESQEGMIITDADNLILRVNQSFTDITGYSAKEVVGKNPRILSSGRQDAVFYAAMWEKLNNTGAWEGEIWNRRKEGEIYPEHLSITAVKDQSGNVTNYVASLVDITLRKASEEEIRNLAFYDPLTGLPNRRLLQERMQHVLASSARSSRKGALLFIDLDNFKALNDTLGHEYGDVLLQQVAHRLESCVREGDTVARLGGDEFVVMLDDLSEHSMEAAAQTEAVGEKIIDKLSQTYKLAAYEYHNTPSIGATLLDGHQQTGDESMKQADIAMYQAKKSGRNTMRFYDPQMQDTITARAALDADLRKALKGLQFQLHYQIQVDDREHPLGAEALIRWMHPERGMVLPGQFIPLAEESELILSIGLWVLDTACAQLKAWQRDALTRDLVLAVNVSAKQMRQADFVAHIQTLVSRHAIDPALLKLEITESMLLENALDAIATMKALKAIGVRLSLDDFGTGYSSLQYLKQLPLDQLKIDQSFVRDLATDNSDKVIVRTVIAMAHSLDLDVIAEGVETDEQRQLLLGKGCFNYQGYLFGKPMPIAEFDAALQRSR